MKKFLFSFTIILLVLAACSLLPQKVSVDDTKAFLNDFERSVNNPTAQYDGENTTLTTAASQDFFNKGGTSKGTILFPSISFNRIFNPIVKAPQFFFNFGYGTYEYDASAYDFVLTDPDNPANGYLFKWIFIDSTNTSHNMSLLFDSLIYYSGDPNQSTPTKLYISLSGDNKDLMWLKINAQYTTISHWNYNEYTPISLQAHLEITNEVALELDYVGHESGDTTVLVDSLRTRIDDIINDDWVEYTVKMNSDSTLKFTEETKKGWFLTLTTQETEIVDQHYEKTDFTGELLYKKVHAADISGYTYNPEDATHISIMIATFPDGSADTILLNPQTPFPQTKK